MQVNPHTRALLRMTALRVHCGRPTMRPRLAQRGRTRRRSVRTSPRRARAPGSKGPSESEPDLVSPAPSGLLGVPSHARRLSALALPALGREGPGAKEVSP
jgi:hypothetical protein